MRPAPRELGIEIGAGATGPANAITDVPGVRVGHCTLVEGDGPLIVGHGPVRTGITVVLPSEEIWERPVFAGCHRLNGNGELTGLEWHRRRRYQRASAPAPMPAACAAGHHGNRSYRRAR